MGAQVCVSGSSQCYLLRHLLGRYLEMVNVLEGIKKRWARRSDMLSHSHPVVSIGIAEVLYN